MMKRYFLSSLVGHLRIISPDKALIKKTREAINLIKKVDKRDYNNIFSRLKVIFITNKSGHTNEFFMPEKIWFTNKSLIKNNNLSWIASLIIHESFHATQFKNGKYILPLSQLEKPALIVQEKFLNKIGDKTGKKDIGTVGRRKYWLKMSKDALSFSYFRNLLNLFEKKKLKIKNIKV